MMRVIPLNGGWRFQRILTEESQVPTWSFVDLPHAPFITDIDSREKWMGVCEYQYIIPPPAGAATGRYALFIGAAMHTTAVFADGKELCTHTGGYLPFEIDLTDLFRDGRDHTVTLRLDNRDNPNIPPGKPLADLDYCWHSGLYRGAELRLYPLIYITDPSAAEVVAGGGIFARTLQLSSEAAVVQVSTHFHNATADAASVRVGVELFLENEAKTHSLSEPIALAPGQSVSSAVDLTLVNPSPWSPSSPNLYNLRVTLLSLEGEIIDQRSERMGVRSLSFTRSGGFTINGEKRRLRGVNRHQEYPYVGYAVPPASHRRDARRIKEAGFDYVRLSHYPQSVEFLEACDELGIVVMNCIPGWQFLGGEEFRQACYQNARELIRRDRNHPSVVLWELSLNETEMDVAFMAKLHAIGHEEYPGDQMFTCGWLDHFDVYIHSRQHGGIHSWKSGDKALVVAEYGDWEFYASNHGFNQKTGAGLFAKWSHGRQLRSDGERGLRQQAMNHVLALNDTLGSPAVLDGLWSIFDYTRGYDPTRAACGIMDVFRIPKFSYYFYRSQRNIDEVGPGWTGGAVLHIASFWTPRSNLRVVIFSNCEEVELRVNGRVVERKAPDKAWMTQFLPHPPFVFELTQFESGTLEAIGFVDGQPAAIDRVSTAGTLSKITLEIDDANIFARSGESDLLIAKVHLLDASGSLCVDVGDEMRFEIQGEAKIIGPAQIAAEAGIASVLIRIPADCVWFRATVSQVGRESPLTTSRAWMSARSSLTGIDVHERVHEASPWNPRFLPVRDSRGATSPASAIPVQPAVSKLAR